MLVQTFKHIKPYVGWDEFHRGGCSILKKIINTYKASFLAPTSLLLHALKPYLLCSWAHLNCLGQVTDNQKAGLRVEQWEVVYFTSVSRQRKKNKMFFHGHYKSQPHEEYF